jgi:hypothetical protein
MNHSSRSNVSVSSGNEAELVTGSLHGLSYIVQFPRSPNSFFDRTAGSQYTAAGKSQRHSVAVSIHPTSHRRRADEISLARHDAVSIALVNVDGGFRLRSPVASHPADIISTISGVLDNVRIGYRTLFLLLLLLQQLLLLQCRISSVHPQLSSSLLRWSYRRRRCRYRREALRRFSRRQSAAASSAVPTVSSRQSNLSSGSGRSNGTSLNSPTLTYVQTYAQSIVVKNVRIELRFGSESRPPVAASSRLRVRANGHLTRASTRVASGLSR